jgi:uncharacterized protein
MTAIHPVDPAAPADLRQLLQTCLSIAVVGLSVDAYRPSHDVARYMQARGYRIVPVNPRYAAAGTPVLGETCYAQLEDIPFAIDMVNVFRRTEDVLPIARSAVAIGAKCVWQQMGVTNIEADVLLRAAGVASVMDRCLKVEHARLLGGPR